jgi:hypothetical protein
MLYTLGILNPRLSIHRMDRAGDLPGQQANTSHVLGQHSADAAVCHLDIRGLFKKYLTFGWEKYIYTPGGLQL